MVFAVAAIGFYPGGTYRDRSLHGYSFFGNSLSDLGSGVAWNGQTNETAAICFAASGIALALAGVLCLLQLPRRFQSGTSKRLIRAAVVIGLLACAGLTAAVVTPEDRSPMLHGVLSRLSTASLAMATVAVALAGLVDKPPRRRASSAWFALSIVVVAWLVAMQSSPASLDPAVPIALQKVLAAALVLVMFVQGEAHARSS